MLTLLIAHGACAIDVGGQRRKNLLERSALAVFKCRKYPANMPPEDIRRGTTPLGDAMQRMVERLADRDPSRQWSLFSDAPLPDDDKAGSGTAGRPGRPPGARNRSTEQFRAFVRATRGDPGLALLDRVFADPKALAHALGAPTAWDVYKAQSDWLLRLLPYFWSAMPAELKIATRGALAVGISGTPGAFPGGDQITNADPFETLLRLAAGQPIAPLQEDQPADTEETANLPVPSKG